MYKIFYLFFLQDIDLNVSSLASALLLKDKLEKDNNNSIANSLALRFYKPLSSSTSIPLSNISTSLSSKKHTRNISSIFSSIQEDQVIKKVKLIDL